MALSASSISGMKYGLPRLIQGVVGDLFREDVDYQLRSFDYAELDITTLELPTIGPWFPQSNILERAEQRARKMA